MPLLILAETFFAPCFSARVRRAVSFTVSLVMLLRARSMPSELWMIRDRSAVVTALPLVLYRAWSKLTVRVPLLMLPDPEEVVTLP